MKSFWNLSLIIGGLILVQTARAQEMTTFQSEFFGFEWTVPKCWKFVAPSEAEKIKALKSSQNKEKTQQEKKK